MDEIEKEKIAALPSQLLVTTICHPMEYAKVLIQLGFEPLPPRRSTTLFGRPAMILPNVFQYIKYIKQSDGFFGCYRGLSARVLGLIASSQLTSKVIATVGVDLPEICDPPNIINDDEPSADDYFKVCRRDVIMHTASVIISYPFHVVSVRMMASFIGKEEEYASLFGAIMAVYRDDGILGFFHGIIPKLLGDVTCVVVTGVMAYYVNKYLVKTKDLRYYTVPLLTFVTSTLTYPLVVVSTCMAVVGSSLKAGNPPIMANYPTCQLKASTKDKAVWQPEVNKLLDLKKQLAALSVATPAGDVAGLEKAIADQGDKVRKLKASTKDKAVWQPEVNVLLDLKKQLAALQTK